MPFAFTRTRCLPGCNARVIIHKCFVNRGVLAAARSRPGWSELLRQGRGSGAPALQLLQDVCRWHDARGSHTARASLLFPDEGPHSSGGAARGPCLPLQSPRTATFIHGSRRDPLQGALSSCGPVLVPTDCVQPLPPQSIPPIFTAMTWPHLWQPPPGWDTQRPPAVPRRL